MLALDERHGDGAAFEREPHPSASFFNSTVDKQTPTKPSIVNSAET